MLPVTFIITRMLRAAVAQSVERRIGSAEVTGPIPVCSFKDAYLFASFFIIKVIF